MTARIEAGERTDLIVVDTGGTFNKRYRPVDGSLTVERGCAAARAILDSASGNLAIDWLQPVCKDSLEIDETDRATIVAAVEAAVERSPGVPVIVIHGTDTIDCTGEALASSLPRARIVLTGSMRPHETDPVESSFNLGLAVGFVRASEQSGVFLAMNGLVRPLGQLVKDRDAGVFRLR
ncbi:MAG: asparaginase [Halothiobacillaceae bacterium]|nr:asparaginase [Halothiobacillaceae bacterium]HER34064.1 asparaginase [Halothiobacillaceae bacterium]